MGVDLYWFNFFVVLFSGKTYSYFRTINHPLDCERILKFENNDFKNKRTFIIIYY